MKKLINRTDSVELSENQIERNKELKEAFEKLFAVVNNTCIGSRETSLGITKLEEAQMWLSKGISREHTTYEEE